jgi:hypothetical protein
MRGHGLRQQNALTRVACPLAKVIAIPAHAIFERVEPARAALDHTGLCKVVDNLWGHPKTPR